jgi:hypothetical protein
MESRAHAVIGAVASAVLVAALWPGRDLPTLGALFGYGLALSVFIDLDHFLVARLTVGDWRNVRRVLDRPMGLLGEQRWIFAEDELTELNRLLSHVVLGGALVAGTWTLSTTLGQFTALVLYVHLLADLLRDNRIV